MAGGKISIPTKFIGQFMNEKRIADLLKGAPGLRPLDIKVFRAVVTEVLNSKEFAQAYASEVLKKSQLIIK
jgi:hypothetical protein